MPPELDGHWHRTCDKMSESLHHPPRERGSLRLLGKDLLTGRLQDGLVLPQTDGDSSVCHLYDVTDAKGPDRGGVCARGRGEPGWALGHR